MIAPVPTTNTTTTTNASATTPTPTTPMRSSDCLTFTRVVLLANGVGANPKAYRPTADVTQWWNRRDALVRCVTAFLLGPDRKDSGDSCSDSDSASKELVIVYDNDWASLYLQYQTNNPTADTDRSRTGGATIVPTEQCIIALWKQAAKSPGKIVSDRGLSCRLVLCPVTDATTRNATTTPTSTTDATRHTLTSGGHSKREIIEHLQTTCSLDFLRQHRLNSSVDTLARTSNRTTLLAAVRAWETRSRAGATPHRPAGPRKRQKTDASLPSSACWQSVLEDVLQPSGANVSRVIAATLHESSDDELPCWDDSACMPRSRHGWPNDDKHDKEQHAADHPADDADPPSPRVQICIFLGAVRDMMPAELRALEQVCGRDDIPSVRVRLGPVAEFTSKILTVVAHHHAHLRLGPSVERLIQQQQQRRRQQQRDKSCLPTRNCASSTTTMLHFICLVPLSSDDVVLDLEQRNQILWSMVRSCVTCLWRSRLAGGSSSHNRSTVHNQLTFWFQNGAVLHLRQDELVASMAEQHQAAPSEYQVLSAIQTKLRDVTSVEKQQQQQPVTDWSSLSRAMVKDILRSSTGRQKPLCLLDFDLETDDASPNLFYSAIRTPTTTSSTKHSDDNPSVRADSFALMITVPLVAAVASADGDASSSLLLMQERKHAFRKAVRRKKIRTVSGRSIVDTKHSVDRVAATITMIQHLAYQGRLQNLLLQD